ncbi:MAG: sulfatase family protein [Alphaproteobacteria bacterium]
MSSVACNRHKKPSDAHNVILIVIDSLRADHVGCYGYDKPTTPALDAFAAGAMRFVNSYATSPWTLPSHASIFTGLHESTHLAARPKSMLHENNITAAELLQATGYKTAGIVCAPFLRSVFQINQGFGLWDEKIAETKRPTVREIKTSRRVTNKALRYLKMRTNDRQPFFLFVHYWDVHYDYNPPEKYTKIFDPDYRGKMHGEQFTQRTRSGEIHPAMKPRDLEHLIALYDGEIRYTDDHLAELLAFLDQSGLAKNTAVIITSDHGDEFFEHGCTGHTFTCYEELIRVPLVIRAPWLQRSTGVIDDVVENVDLFPTILALADLPPVRHKIHGFNLLPLIETGRPPARQYFFCETQMGRRFGWKGVKGTWRSLRDQAGIKLNYFTGQGRKFYELYDLAADPGERSDLARERDDRRKQMALELGQLHREHRQLADERQIKMRSIKSKKKKKRARAEEELEEQLKGLGYIE